MRSNSQQIQINNNLDISNEKQSLIPSKRSDSKITVLSAAAINVTGIIGPGVLTLSASLRDGGWSALFLLFVTVWICKWTAELLCKCSDHVDLHFPNKGITGGADLYGAIGFAVGGERMQYLVWITQYGTLFGVAAVFFLLMGGIVDYIADQEGESWSFTYLTLVIWAILAICLALPDFSALSRLSWLVFGTTAIAIVFLIFYVPTQDGPADDTKFFNSDFGLSFSAIIFSMGNHAMFLEVRSNLQNAEETSKLFSVTYSSIFALYVPIAVTGYLAYGGDTESPILDNLPYNGWTLVVNLIFLFNVGVSYLLVLQPLFQFLADGFPQYFDIKSSSIKTRLTSYIFRVILSLLTWTLAISIGDFGTAITYLTALTVSLTAFIYPCAFGLILLDLSKFEKIFCYFIIAYGLVGTSIAIYYTATASSSDSSSS